MPGGRLTAVFPFCGAEVNFRGRGSFIMALTLFLVFLYAAGTALVLPTPLEAVLTGVKFAPG